MKEEGSVAWKSQWSAPCGFRGHHVRVRNRGEDSCKVQHALYDSFVTIHLNTGDLPVTSMACKVHSFRGKVSDTRQHGMRVGQTASDGKGVCWCSPDLTEVCLANLHCSSWHLQRPDEGGSRKSEKDRVRKVRRDAHHRPAVPTMKCEVGSEQTPVVKE